jgi:tetraacyldisaccharide 4'-kinase
VLDWLSKILLFPLTLLFGLGVHIRLWLYRHHFLGSTEFDVPVICVGNLNVGGSGKTPMIEFLVKLIQSKYPVGIISRGYGRSTSGFIRLNNQHQAAEAGDEPLLLKLKHPQAEVAVGEARVIAIPKLLSEAPHLKAILMDDGFQHLSVRPQVNMLLTSYQMPFWKDHLMPMGTLREYPSAKERAHIIVVTKCPENLSEADLEACRQSICPRPDQKIFFSSLQYGQPYLLFGGNATISASENLIALSGIADAALFIEHISQTQEPIHFEFGDHHVFRLDELKNIVKNYPENKTWITTEKDAVRLIPFRSWFLENGIALWVQPVQVSFLKHNREDLSALLLQYLAFYYPEPAPSADLHKDAE